MRGSVLDICGCFPTGLHYPGIADRIAATVTRIEGLCEEFSVSELWADAPLVVIDFVTTGLNPETDRVLEVGIVAFDGGRVTSQRHWLVNPGIPVPEEATAVHGITNEELKDAPSFAEIADELFGILQGRLAVAYNAPFDQSFLRAEFGRLMQYETAPLPPALRPQVHWIDPLVWVRELHKYEKGKKLTDVCGRLGIALEQAHRAAGDAEAAGHVLLKLADQMPQSYGELIRLQQRYAARQDADLTAWRANRPN